MSSRKKISIKDVSEMAGVSVSAVSAVLNNKVGISIRVGEKTKDKIRKVANELGYVPNPAAQNLVSGRSHIVSVFTYEAIFPFTLENEFYRFLLGIEKQSEISGYDLLLLTNRKFRDNKSIQNEASLNRLKLGDGGILLGIEKQSETIKRLIDEGFPLVFIGRRDISDRPINIVSYNYKSIIEKLVNLAIEYGHSNSVYLRLNENSEPYDDRQKAINSILHKNSKLKNETQIIEENDSFISIIQNFINSGVTIFFVERISLALQLEDVFNELELKIGEDISIILFEDQWLPSNFNWTSWSNSRHTIGMQALNLLDLIITKKIEGHKTILIDPEINYGETLKKI